MMVLTMTTMNDEFDFRVFSADGVTHKAAKGRAGARHSGGRRTETRAGRATSTRRVSSSSGRPSDAVGGRTGLVDGVGACPATQGRRKACVPH